MEFGLNIVALEFPSTDVAEVFVVTLCFAFFGLAFFTEVTAARFFTVEGVEGEDFCEFKEVSQTAGTFQVLVEGTFGANNVDVFVEFFAECGDFLESLFEASLVTGHTNVFPHDVTELTMDIVNSAVTLDGKELGNLFCGLLLAVFESRIRFGNLFQLGASK